MKKTMKYAITYISIIIIISPCYGQSSLSSDDFHAIADVIQRDFSFIDSIRTIGMTDEIGGRFDVVIVGSKRGNNGWRVEVLSSTNHRITTKWDSHILANETEFTQSGAKAITINIEDYNYDLLIEGCAPHLCSDGISGFLLFSGKSGETSKAKIVTQGMEKPFTKYQKYEVTFSKNIIDNARKKLEQAICESTSISNKTGLPFKCKNTE